MEQAVTVAAFQAELVADQARRRTKLREDAEAVSISRLTREMALRERDWIEAHRRRTIEAVRLPPAALFRLAVSRKVGSNRLSRCEKRRSSAGRAAVFGGSRVGVRALGLPADETTLT